MASIAALSQLTLPVAPAASGQAATKAYTDEGLRTVSSLASITSPVTGQLALLTTDSMIYRYTGSAWLGVQHTAAGAGYARYERWTTQAISSGTVTKLAFTTAASTHADVTANGSFDVFTLNRAGTWRIAATSGYPSGTGSGRALWLGDSTDTARYEFVNVASNTGWITALHVTTTIRVSAAHQVAAFTYQDSGTSQDTEATQVRPSLTFFWEGP